MVQDTNEVVIYTVW